MKMNLELKLGVQAREVLNDIQDEVGASNVDIIRDALRFYVKLVELYKNDKMLASYDPNNANTRFKVLEFTDLDSPLVRYAARHLKK